MLVGLALTGQTPAFSDSLRADTRAHLLADLHGVLSTVWTSFSTFGDGYDYTLTSPQSLSARCRIWSPGDAGFPDCIAAQFLSVDGLRVGPKHYIVTNRSDLAGYQVWANQCQVFFAQPGVYRNHWVGGEDGRRSFAGGVPYAYGPFSGACLAQSPSPGVTTEVWWSCGDVDAAGLNAPCWRNDYWCACFAACHNAVLRVATSAVRTNSALQIAGIFPAAKPFGSLYASAWPSGLQWPGSDGATPQPLFYDPLLGWSTDNAGDAVVRAQLWDACCMTAASTVDAEVQSKDSATGAVGLWRNYLYYGSSGSSDALVMSLLLLRSITLPPASAYMYPQYRRPHFPGAWRI